MPRFAVVSAGVRARRGGRHDRELCGRLHVRQARRQHEAEAAAGELLRPIFSFMAASSKQGATAIELCLTAVVVCAGLLLAEDLTSFHTFYCTALYALCSRKPAFVVIRLARCFVLCLIVMITLRFVGVQTLLFSASFECLEPSNPLATRAKSFTDQVRLKRCSFRPIILSQSPPVIGRASA